MVVCFFFFFLSASGKTRKNLSSGQEIEQREY